MSLGHGVSAVKDGLVFAYDMANTAKSWKGVPTTNLLVQPLSFQTGYTTESWTTGQVVDNDQIAPDGTKTATRVTRVSGYFYKSNTTAPTFTITPGQTITFSCWVKKLDTTDQTGRGLYIWCYNGAGSANRAAATQELFTDKWVRQTVTYTALAGETAFSFGFSGSNGNHLIGSIAIWHPQVEIGNFASPFVNGTRSNNQSIIDLTRNKTVTVSNLPRSADGSLSFDGTASFDITTIDFSSAQTIELWLKPKESDATRRNPYNQAYGGFGTITHEPSGVFNLYYGDSGLNDIPYLGHASSFTVAQNEVACVCATRDTAISWWYKNGVQNTSYPHSYGTLAATAANITIGSGYAGPYIGDIYAVKLYNRALTAAEVKQNFEAQRGRYGI